MYPTWYSMTMVVLSILVLFFMIVKLRIHPFITMTVVAVGLALAMGVPLIDPKAGIFAVMEPAMGKQLGHMVPLIALGCLIGEIIRRSGGSEVLGERMLQRFGNRRGPLAMAVCGLLVGSTIFFDTAVILLAPVTIAVARQSKKSIIFFAIPMAVAVLGMHSIVPPPPRGGSHRHGPERELRAPDHVRVARHVAGCRYRLSLFPVGGPETDVQRHHRPGRGLRRRRSQ